MPLRYLINWFSPEEEKSEEIKPKKEYDREIKLKNLYKTILDREIKNEEMEYYMKNLYTIERIEKSLLKSNEANEVRNKIFNFDTWVKFCEEHSYFTRLFDLIDPPSQDDNNLVFIDFRFLNNFEFIIRNALHKLNGNFMTTFVCNNNNYERVKILCDSISPNIQILKLDNNINSQLEYNNLLLTPDFWKKLDGKNILIHQFDAIIFKKNFINFINYDYIGSPMNTDDGIIMNGGFSMRKKEKMIKLLEKHQPKNIFEDKFFNSKVLMDSEIANQFGTQHFDTNSFGGHCFWEAKRYTSKELYEKLFKSDSFSKYPVLFHKYSLELADPDKKISYPRRNEVKSDKRLVCHIHCYDIGNFEEFFGHYYENIKKHFFVIVTYSKGIALIEDFNEVVLLNIENKGADIGGKFCTTHYLKNINYDYDFILMIHSKSNKNKRETYLKPLVGNIEKTISLLNKDTGIYCPELILKGGLEIIYDKRKITSFDNFMKISDWGRNREYMTDVINYFKLPDYNLLFPEGNFYIISKEICEMMYSDTKIYNCLNTKSSFDYLWVKNYYKLGKDINIFNTYMKFRKDNLFGNNFDQGKGWEGLADCMLEHTFERLPFGFCKKLNKKVHILNYEDNIIFNKFLYKGDIKVLSLKPATIVACHTSSQMKLDAIKNNIKYLRHLSSEIYIVNSKEFEGKLEKLLVEDDSIILNNELTYTQAKKYLESYEDLIQNNLSIEAAKEHWNEFGKKENRIVKDTYSVHIHYIENDGFVCQGKWKQMLEKIKDNFKSFILTNDSFFITRRLDDFQNLILGNKEMISIIDSNERKHHYMDFLRYYSLSGVEKLLKFYTENFTDCDNFFDVIKKLEIESTFITEDRDCLYKMETKYERNLHFDDEKYPFYLNELNYPIIKIKKLSFNHYTGIPENFNPEEYKNLHIDLKQMTLPQAEEHFKFFGYREGRPYKKNQKIELPKYLEDYIEEKKIKITKI